MKLLRLPEVMLKVRLSKTSIYKLMAASEFPQPIKQGTASFWVESEVDAYLEALIAARPTSLPIAA